MPDMPKFWYKGYATLDSGLPTLFEGGVPADTAAQALSIVRAMSGGWMVRKLHSIYIYRLMVGGVVANEPEIFVNLSDEAVPPAEVHTCVKESLEDVLDNAKWTLQCADTETTYPTLKFKEDAK